MIKNLIVLSSLIPAIAVEAASFATNINFDEAAFSDGALNGTSSYNVLDDISGAELTTLNSDLDDISITATLSGAGTYFPGYSGTNSLTLNATSGGGRITANHQFNGTPADMTGDINNAGTRSTSVIQINFASHLSVTEFSFDVSSVNTRSTSWELTIFELLDLNGNSLGTTPTISDYLNHTEINNNVNAVTNSGVYVLDSKATVLNVGTNETMVGTSNSNENFTNTGDLEYSDFNIAAGTRIGGLRMTTILEDTRGTMNSNSDLNSSLIDFTFSGTIVPEPSSFVLSIVGAFCLAIRRKR